MLLVLLAASTGHLSTSINASPTIRPSNIDVCRPDQYEFNAVLFQTHSRYTELVKVLFLSLSLFLSLALSLSHSLTHRHGLLWRPVFAALPNPWKLVISQKSRSTARGVGRLFDVLVESFELFFE